MTVISPVYTIIGYAGLWSLFYLLSWLRVKSDLSAKIHSLPYIYKMHRLNIRIVYIVMIEYFIINYCFPYILINSVPPLLLCLILILPIWNSFLSPQCPVVLHTLRIALWRGAHRSAFPVQEHRLESGELEFRSELYYSPAWWLFDLLS